MKKTRVVAFNIVTLIVLIALIGAIGYGTYLLFFPSGEVVINNHTYRKRDDHISFHDKDMSVVAYKRLRLIDDKVVEEYDVLCTPRGKASGKNKGFFIQPKGIAEFISTSSGNIYEDNGKSTLAVAVPYKSLAEGKAQFSFQLLPTVTGDEFTDSLLNKFDVFTSNADIDGKEVSFSNHKNRCIRYFNDATNWLLFLLEAVGVVILSFLLYVGWNELSYSIEGD